MTLLKASVTDLDLGYVWILSQIIQKYEESTLSFDRSFV